jgi:hypothetical protein
MKSETNEAKRRSFRVLSCFAAAPGQRYTRWGLLRLHPSTLASQPSARSFSARRAASLAATVLSVLAFFALLTASASAAEERAHIFAASFGEGQLSLLAPGVNTPGSGVAVNQSTHDVYVADTANHRVEQFSSAGVFVRAWGWGVSDGASEFEVCTLACLPGLAGTAPGQFETPVSIAVDNAPGGEGDVYVADYAGFQSPDSHVQKFTAEGALVKSWGVEGQLGEGPLTNNEGFFDIGGITVDSTGELWASTGNGLFEFERSGTFVRRTSLEHLSGSSIGLAAAAAGETYATTAGEVREFDASGADLGEVFAAGEQSLTGAAFDLGTNELLVDERTSIATVPGSCVSRSEPPFCSASATFGAPQLSGGAGLAVDSESHAVFAADTAANRIDVFALEPPGPPVVTNESLSNVTGDSATLEANVNPRGEPGEEPTRYEFQYGACASASTCTSSPYDHAAPAPEGSIAPDFESHLVTVHVSGLTPGSLYHYRLVAHNSHGPVEGPEQTFTTQGSGGSLVLPDGRQWEMVSPPNKLGALIEPIAEFGVVQAAVGGDGITYLANTAIESNAEGSANEVQVLSTRSSGGWSSRNIAIPHVAPTGRPNGVGLEDRLFAPDLSSSVIQPMGPFNPGLSPEEASEDTAFLHNLNPSCGTSCYRPLVTSKPGFANVEPSVHFGEDALCEAQSVGQARPICGPFFEGGSEDLHNIVLKAKAELVPGTATGQLYEWRGGPLAPVSLLPGGEPAERPLLSQGNGAVSSDGSRIVWRDAATTELFLRDQTSLKTIQLDQAEAGCTPCESGGGSFQVASRVASPSGYRVLFTSHGALTEDSGASPNGAGGSEARDLYECKIPAGSLICQLTDLTPVHEGERASVQEEVLGASQDASWVYFVAHGVQATTPNSRGQTAVPGRPNLYLRHEGTTTFITTLSAGDGHDWLGLVEQPTRVSPGGRWLEFMSQATPTGYDNRDVATGKPVAEVYLYDAAANRVLCASCDPTGARPVGVEDEKIAADHGGLAGGVKTWPSHELMAANVPGSVSYDRPAALHQPRYLFDSGRLFFNSADGVVPQDSNGTEDVYEFEPAGMKNAEGRELCTTASTTFSAASGGCVALISSGTSGQESAFLDASETGGDVFFLTSARLLPGQDVDAARDVYDAHECTSASPCLPPVAQAPPACTTEPSCKASPAPQPSIFGAPASATFAGPGNLTRPPAAPVKHKTAAQLRAEKLKKALKACKKDKQKHKRQACEKQARKRYGAKAATHKPGK